jgi:hypothetical protein
MGRRQTLAAKMDTVPIGTDGDQSEGRVNRATGARERRDKRRRCWMGEARVLKKPATAANNNATQINVERRDNHQRRSGKGLKEKRAGQKGGRNLRSAVFLEVEVTIHVFIDRQPPWMQPRGLTQGRSSHPMQSARWHHSLPRYSPAKHCLLNTSAIAWGHFDSIPVREAELCGCQGGIFCREIRNCE